MTKINTKDLGEKIVKELKSIFDPEIPVDIYELGLIYDVFVNEDNEVKIYIPNDANIYNMTLGGYLSKEHINNPALIFEDKNGNVINYTFGEVEAMSNGLASKLSSLGYNFGSNIAVHTGQHPDTAIAHMAICKIGGVAVTPVSYTHLTLPTNREV